MPLVCTQLDDLLERLWNLEDVHRDLVQTIHRLVAHLEKSPEHTPLPQETVSTH